MKRGLIIILIFLILIISSILAQMNDTITGKAIIGKATQSFGINVTVTAAGPSLTIEKPKNKTYIFNDNLELNFDTSNKNTVLYNIDLGANTTITGNTIFNTTAGSHTLYLYANNSDGTTTKNVTFFVNLTLFTIYYDEFNGTKKGSSNDFNKLPYDELQNLSNITFENIDFGYIVFNDSINLTDDDNFSDSFINFTKHVNISFNRVELNSSALTNFNKSAKIKLYNLTFTNPRILRDSSICSSTICTKESYSNGILKFNVTGFSIYSSEETPSTDSGGTEGGGSGRDSGEGETVKTTFKDFSIDKEKIKISLKQGETKKQEITIKNTGSTTIRIDLKNEFKDFLNFSETGFDLKEGKTRKIVLNFIAKENAIPDLYNGKIIVKGDNIEKVILITMEIESKKPASFWFSIEKKFLFNKYQIILLIFIIIILLAIIFKLWNRKIKRKAIKTIKP